MNIDELINRFIIWMLVNTDMGNWDAEVIKLVETKLKELIAEKQ